MRTARPAGVSAPPLLERDHLPVACLCERSCAETVRVAADLIDLVALEQAEVVRARISGIAQSLGESGVVLRAVDIPQPARSQLLSCVEAN